MIEPLRLEDDGVVMLDQRLLPAEERWVTCTSTADVVEAIRMMIVRGAPAIGIAAAYGMALAARAGAGETVEAFNARLREAGKALCAARPTAVNLAWAVDRVLGVAEAALADGAAAGDAAQMLEADARAIHEEDVAANRAMGKHGSIFIKDGARVLTHCNAGALATGGYGTALGLIRAAVEEGKTVSVFADETRPFLQGARLTAWELHRDGIPVTVISDNMAGALMARGEVDVVVVGSDRIARNGDVANKIGTYTVAVLARRHGIPFYVAAPTSTIDYDCPSGAQIPIEERSAEEVTHLGGVRIAPEGVSARHPAFDVTPAALVTAIITEAGVSRAPYETSLARALGLDETAAETADVADVAEVAEVADVADEAPAEVEPQPAEDAAPPAGDEDDAPVEDGIDDEEDIF